MNATSFDVIVVGAGHNGLVCGALLARAGRRVLVLEAADEVGGATRSAELTRAGVAHDVFATNLTAFRNGPAWALLGSDLERHGLRFVHTGQPYASAFPDGRSLQVHQGLGPTLEALRRHDGRDAAGWADLYGRFERYAPVLFGLLGSRVPSLRMTGRLLAGARSVGVDGMGELAHILLSTPRQLADDFLASREAKALLAAWGLHADFGPDVAGGALLPFIECLSLMHSGMWVAESGASRLPEALAAVIVERGGRVRTGAQVRRIATGPDGRARAVVCADGSEYRAGSAIVASVPPAALLDELLADVPDLDQAREQARRFDLGLGTMMVHLLLDGPVPWAAGPELSRSAYVHLGPYVEDLADTYTAAQNGRLPADPLLVVGQTSAVDPTRAPDGMHVVWVQVRVLPTTVAGDAASRIAPGPWDVVAGPVADRVTAKLETYAPGLGARIVERAVLGPHDLERWNANLVGGTSAPGALHLRQNGPLRPLRGWSTYDTPVPGLFLTGASTWPGGGVTAAPGILAAERVLRPGVIAGARRLRGRRRQAPQGPAS